MQKARRHPTKGLRPLVSTRFQVLFTPLFRVLFTFPSRYWFTIGLSGVCSLSGWCRWIQTGFLRPRLTQESSIVRKQFVYRTLTVSGWPSHAIQLSLRNQMLRSYNPAVAVTTVVWAPPRSLATTWGIICYFLFLRVLRCFSSPGLPLALRLKYLRFTQVGCPIRKSVDQRVCAPPHSLSQLITSFIASESLGIPRAPFVTSVKATAFR